MSITTIREFTSIPYMAIAEIGVNHNGSVDTAIELCSEAHTAGATFLKFQKRDPDLIPEHMKQQLKSTPWGEMTYIEYKHRIELSSDDYKAIDAHCKQLGVRWSASVWDDTSLRFLLEHNDDLPFIKVSSAMASNLSLVRDVAANGIHMFISTGGMTLEDIHITKQVLENEYPDTPTTFFFCRAIYPPTFGQINMNQMDSLRKVVGARGSNIEDFKNLGYSGHERSNFPSLMAAARGAHIIERHFTLDRAMWGSDQSLSLEPREFWDLTHRLSELSVIDGPDTNFMWKPHPKEIEKLSTQRAPQK